jgi:hypothetical protein
MDIKRKTCNIWTWGKNIYFSTNIDTLVPSLYQCVETRSIEVFWLLSQPLPHLRFNLFVISETFVTFLNPVVNRFTRQTFPTVNISLWISFALNPFSHKERHKITLLISRILLKQSPFWLLISASVHAHARLLPRLSWSWNVLLPNYTYWKPITFITAVLLPFVTYLLTLPRMSRFSKWYLPCILTKRL